MTEQTDYIYIKTLVNLQVGHFIVYHLHSND